MIFVVSGEIVNENRELVERVLEDVMYNVMTISESVIQMIVTYFRACS